MYSEIAYLGWVNQNQILEQEREDTEPGYLIFQK